MISLPHSVAELLKYFQKFKMAAVRHLKLLFGYSRPPTKFYCWPEACVQIWCRSDLYLRRYLRSNISQVWLKMPIRAPKIYVLGVFWPINIIFNHRDTQKALPWRKRRAMSHRASKSVQRCGQDAVRRIQKNFKKQRVEPKTVTNWVSAPPTPLFRSAPSDTMGVTHVGWHPGRVS